MLLYWRAAVQLLAGHGSIPSCLLATVVFTVLRERLHTYRLQQHTSGRNRSDDTLQLVVLHIANLPRERAVRRNSAELGSFCRLNAGA